MMKYRVEIIAGNKYKEVERGINLFLKKMSKKKHKLIDIKYTCADSANLAISAVIIYSTIFKK